MQGTSNDSKTTDDLGRPHRRGCIRTWKLLRSVLKADLYRYSGGASAGHFWRHYAFTPGYKYTVLMRTTGWLSAQPLKGFGVYYLLKMILLRARYKYGFAIPEYMVIGPGLFINRFGGVYMNGDAVIGNNANVTHGSMLGQANRGLYRGSPVLGNRVFIGAGAKIIGRLRVGDDSSIGSNAVVTKEVPVHGVVGGVPAKLISTAGSDGYINRQVPIALMKRCEGAFFGPVPDEIFEVGPAAGA
ncbi:Serine acetyltransferase [Sphingomonas paucimobilis]|nr:Serine acetyltransferase [Sphingomonas paucimobilis]